MRQSVIFQFTHHCDRKYSRSLPSSPNFNDRRLEVSNPVFVNKASPDELWAKLAALGQSPPELGKY